MEFREMRRRGQQLSEEACREILEGNTSGVLAVCGDGGYPYAVPLSYAYDGQALYFHCAKTGHKLDAIRANGKVSFCVIDRDQVVPEAYTTLFRSVIVFGQAQVLEREDEIRRAMELLAVKYAPTDTEPGRRAAIDRELARLCVIRLEIAHMTGKAARELVREKA